jgi:hypothetical protein
VSLDDGTLLVLELLRSQLHGRGNLSVKRSLGASADCSANEPEDRYYNGAEEFRSGVEIRTTRAAPTAEMFSRSVLISSLLRMCGGIGPHTVQHVEQLLDGAHVCSTAAPRASGRLHGSVHTGNVAQIPLR